MAATTVVSARTLSSRITFAAPALTSNARFNSAIVSGPHRGRDLLQCRRVRHPSPSNREDLAAQMLRERGRVRARRRGRRHESRSMMILGHELDIEVAVCP